MHDDPDFDRRHHGKSDRRTPGEGDRITLVRRPFVIAFAAAFCLVFYAGLVLGAIALCEVLGLIVWKDLGAFAKGWFVFSTCLIFGSFVLVVVMAAVGGDD